MLILHLYIEIRCELSIDKHLKKFQCTILSFEHASANTCVRDVKNTKRRNLAGCRNEYQLVLRRWPSLITITDTCIYRIIGAGVLKINLLSYL